jgi:primosomal protein N' (replication factor Y)
VDVCVDVPLLAVDRPFTYLLPEGEDAGIGSLVSVRFHGRTVRGWIVGPPIEVPRARLLRVTRVRSSVRFFDEPMLELLRWMSERYIAPLCTVIARSHPPRVASEEALHERRMLTPGDPPASRVRSAGPPRATRRRTDAILSTYGGLSLEPGVTTWLRPLPGEEGITCVEAVEACLASGREAVVVVPTAEPVPATARSVLERFGDLAVAFLGGDSRSRYGTWLEIKAGRYQVVVGTRPAVLAPLSRLGLIWISREVHSGHREERAPYHHVRDVAVARARIDGSACVLASLSPSVETAVSAASGDFLVARPPRTTERAAAPLVETTPPEAEDRSIRLAKLVRRAGSAVLIASRSGYGVARVCRACGEPAACAACRGPLVKESGQVRCRVCGAPGRCANCGAGAFSVEPGGAERLAEWARHVAKVPVKLVKEGLYRAPDAESVLVGTAAAVGDVGDVRLDLVAILDPDRALLRAGVRAGEQALATWSEASAWAGPRGGGGRVLLQTRRQGHPAIQALIRWDPSRFLLKEAERRAEAGFPPHDPVFRVEGGAGLADNLPAAAVRTLLSTTEGPRTVCLVAVRPEALGGFRREILRLAADGALSRVEAEPQL